MSKRPSKSKPAKGNQPEPAQLKAIEHLIQERDYARAIARARALVRRFPDHGGSWRLLVDALAHGQGKAAAGLAAYQWAERRPNSLPAQEALLGFAADCRHLLLADQAAARVCELGGETQGFPLPEHLMEGFLEAPDGSRTTHDELIRFDIGKLHLDAHDFAGAVRILESIDTTPARNNRALALFHLGRIQDALSGFLAAWQRDPGNLFGLGWAIRTRLFLGDETGARGLAVPLAQGPARRGEDAYGQVSALLLLQENQSAWDAFERSTETEWAGMETGLMGAERLNLGGCAASRLGHGDQARALWQRSRQMHPKLGHAENNLDALERDGVPPAYPELLDHTHALPLAWVNAVREAGAASADLERRVDALTASDAYLGTLYLSIGQPLRQLIAYILKRRLRFPFPVETAPGERRAPGILRDLARLPVGTPSERLEFLNALREAKAIAPDETVDFWDGKGLRRVRTVSTDIYREPESSDLPEDLQVQLEESILRYQVRRFEESEACLNAILERIPDHRIALGNLAAIRVTQGRDTEAQEILRRVVTAHPDYLIARCNLATMLIEEGDLDQAHTLLDGLFERPRMHIQDVFELYGAMAMLNRARGNDEVADGLIATLEGMVADEEDAGRLAQARRRVARVARGGRSRAASEPAPET